MAVILETSLGDLTIDLMTDDRPRACLNFLKLCKIKYYNMCLFHTIQRNLMAQSGDPEGTGRGGRSVFANVYGDQAAFFEAELKPRIKHTRRGLISMVNDGNNMHGSQFFITLADGLDYLDQQGHTVFGEVSEGEEVIDKLNEIYCDKDGKPFQNIRILHTVIIDDPYDDPQNLDVPPSSPVPDMKALENGRLEYDDEIDPYKGKTEEEIREMEAEKEAQANAQILEMIGDLPDQDVAPEDNVLFVCKLNPVTTDEDLEIIFSRFGPIKSCEVIRDYKTKESLQYAFIEFEKPEHCENAYFKMDNVLIDDRRIHVDFSQSVAKVKWKGKGKGVEVMDDKKRSGESAGSKQQIYGLDFDNWTSRKGKQKVVNTDHRSSSTRSDRRERIPDRGYNSWKNNRQSRPEVHSRNSGDRYDRRDRDYRRRSRSRDRDDRRRRSRSRDRRR